MPIVPTACPYAQPHRATPSDLEKFHRAPSATICRSFFKYFKYRISKIKCSTQHNNDISITSTSKYHPPSNSGPFPQPLRQKKGPVPNTILLMPIYIFTVTFRHLDLLVWLLKFETPDYSLTSNMSRNQEGLKTQPLPKLCETNLQDGCARQRQAKLSSQSQSRQKQSLVAGPEEPFMVVKKQS